MVLVKPLKTKREYDKKRSFFMQPINLNLNLPITESCKDCNCCFPIRKKSDPIDIPKPKVKETDYIINYVKERVFTKR